MARFGVDLLDVWRGTLSPRKVAVYVAALPADSATARAIHGSDVEWTLQAQLLAGAVDVLSQMSWQLGGDKHAKRPERIIRPGVKDPRTRHGRTTRSRAEVVAYLRRHGPKGGVADAQRT